MLAVGLLAVALLSVLALFSKGLHLMSRSKELTVSTEVARETMEAIRIADATTIPVSDVTFDGRPPTVAPAIPGPPVFPPSPYPSKTVGGRQYDIVVRVTSPGLSEVRAVEVEVFWEQGSSTTLQTFFLP